MGYARRMTIRGLLFTLFVITVCFSASAKERCYDEVREELDPAVLAQQASGRSAAEVLKHVVELLEPSFPPLQRSVDLPVAADDPDRETFAYLADRQLLGTTWDPTTFSLDAWNAALAVVAGWYELPAPVLEDSAPRNTNLLESLAPILEGAGAALDPVAVFAFDPADPTKISFWATLRNGIYPRLIVVHPPDEPINVQEDVEGAMAELSDCVVTIGRYVYTNATSAQELFLATNESRMVVLAADPPASQELLEVPSGEETSYLTFSNREMTDKTRYTALFLGPSVGFGQLLGLLPQLRTNMSPQAILSFLGGS